MRPISTAVWCLILALPLPLTSAAAQARPRAERPPAGRLRQYAAGLLARTTYVAPASGRYHVEIWDLVVGPGMKTADSVRLPGGAALEVRAGTGTIVIGGKEHRFKPGAMFDIGEGIPFALQNGRDDLALAIRATVIRLRRR